MERLTEKQKHILQTKLCDMKRRCNNPKDKFYKDYGGRGIKICSEWMDKKKGHENFQKWALSSGWKEGFSIDRIDVNGDYEPSNCRWATPKEQANNRRNNLYVTIHGVTKTSTEWAEEIGITENSFALRVKSGWSEERLLEPKTKPLKMSKAEMAREIRSWRKAEEKGLLFRLPCKIGDTVYFPSETDGECEPYVDVGKVFAIGIDERRVMWISVRYESGLKYYHTSDDFGKTVFLTREEAEKSLAEMGEQVCIRQKM